jgi:putative transposase
MARKRYPTDLTDSQWKRIEPFVPPPKTGGRPRSTDMREVLNAIFYVTRTGCAWRLLPHDFPPWQTVYDFFNKWRDDETWAVMNARLREQVRRRAGRREEPRIAVIDSQSVKTTDRGGERGFDAGKKDQRPQAACAR